MHSPYKTQLNKEWLSQPEYAVRSRNPLQESLRNKESTNDRREGDGDQMFVLFSKNVL